MTDALMITTEHTGVALSDLATKANALHAACEAAAQSMIRHARDCGDVLLQAKEEIGHGGFEDWIRDNGRFSPRMARNYMRIANGWESLLKLTAKTKRKRVAVLGQLDSLSMREALRLLSAGGPEQEGGYWITDQRCPACGAFMVQTSALWCTCNHCMECRLHGHAIGHMTLKKSAPDELAQHLSRARRHVSELDASGLQDLIESAKRRLAKLSDQIKEAETQGRLPDGSQDQDHRQTA